MLNKSKQNFEKTVKLYDTTLRDGSQRQGISFSINDKLRITKLLDNLGISYIEGGWPGSNPKDSQYFSEAAKLKLQHAKIVAFGSTRHFRFSVAEDPNIKALVAANTPAVALVGKSWTLHVQAVLETTQDENLKMIEESVSYLKSLGKEVIYDAEHFFDGYRDDPSYALETLQAAVRGGADWLVLCDTNGGSLPSWLAEVVQSVGQRFDTALGIHAHNDSELAVANSLAAVQAGARQIQGTINGYGERCGNANLISLVPTLQLKMGYTCLAAEKLSELAKLSRAVDEIANLNPNPHAAYVGSAAFAHKGGIHVAAVEKVRASYEHVAPELIGNRRHVLVSELSGRGNIRVRANELGLEIKGNEKQVLAKIKDLESQGFQFENAEGTFELLIRRSAPNYVAPFEIIDMMVVSEKRSGRALCAEAIVKVNVGGQLMHTASEGSGPVHALDQALRKALLPCFPHIAEVRLADYKVRILDSKQATGAVTRVLIEASCANEHWTTIGCSSNIIDASCQALSDSLELYLIRSADKAADLSVAANTYER